MFVKLKYILFLANAFHGATLEGLKCVNENNEINYFKSHREGNFIGLIKLLSTENTDLKLHLDECRAGKNTVTYLSPKYVNKVLDQTCKYLINKIVAEINQNENKKFGICVDTTTDVTTMHQTSIVVRYLSSGNNIIERTVSFSESKDGSGKGIFKVIKDALNEIGLNTCNIAGCSFDGASAMNSGNVGVFHHLTLENCKCVYCWCFAHRFNLCVEDAYKKSIILQNSIALANNTAKLFKASSSRMAIWRNVAKCTPNYKSNQRLKLIGQTRWGTKRSMLKNIISTDLHLFVVLRSLIEICNSELDSNTLQTVCQLLTSWMSYETCIVTYLFHMVFSRLDSVSKKMQEYGLNVLAAMIAIEDFYNDLNELQESLLTFSEVAHHLVMTVNNLLEQDSFVSSIRANFKINIPASRNGIKEIQQRSIKEVGEYIELLKTSIGHHFTNEIKKDDDFYKELSYLDLRCFDEFIKSNNTDTDDIDLSFKTLCSRAGVDDSAIFNQLKAFNKEYREEQRKMNGFSFFEKDSIPSSSSAVSTNSNAVNVNDCLFLTMSEDKEDNILLDNAEQNENVSQDSYCHVYVIDDENDFEDASEPEDYISMKKECYCITCILKYLSREENKLRFEELFNLYKYVAILPTTQVKCERDFSLLKITKNRLRSQLGQTTLNNMMIISLCREMFKEISFDHLVDKIVAKSNLARNLF